ncbi:MAG: tRNA uridine-5-carboxymethylaminomethyl(34) synthesis enzyme MnmG [Pseudomonadota bacterium]
MEAVDIVVVGAGHAGVEAALAASRIGCRVVLITTDTDAVSRMSCNPAIGGLGKGHLVREIDALGGEMGLCADATGIQFRRLNKRKGAAVRGTRCQSDKIKYSRTMAKTLLCAQRLELLRSEVTSVLIEHHRTTGVVLADGQKIVCRAVVLTTGTFLAGMIHVGDKSWPGGRTDEAPAIKLAEFLRSFGFKLGRLKTGTPCRLDGRTLNYDLLEVQPGDVPPPRFSRRNDWIENKPPMPQVFCHIAHTNPRTHEIIKENLHRSAMYSGKIKSIGPRYCPSIEDKIVRFSDRDRHQIFIEPEGLDTVEVYPNGISTSLPADVQEQMVHSIQGLEHAKLIRLGYAVEYDYCDPLQLLLTLQVRDVEGLFFCGQINGTTGYEEAAAQGLLGGINAARFVLGQAGVVFRRDTSYLGVMVDDLVTRGVNEPYRMFTSRAEYRLLLREDNADSRLTPLGRELGLVSEQHWARFCEQQDQISHLMDHLASTKVPAQSTLSRLLSEVGTTPAKPGSRILELLRRPEVDVRLLTEAGLVPSALCQDEMSVEQAEIEVKYEGYIQRQIKEVQKLENLEIFCLPKDLDYENIPGLSNEVREKLSKMRPLSLGQASRICGITPAAIALLLVHLRGRKAKQRKNVDAQ